DENGRPQALAWNMGTTESTRSDSLRAKVSAIACTKHCRTRARWLGREEHRRALEDGADGERDVHHETVHGIPPVTIRRRPGNRARARRTLRAAGGGDDGRHRRWWRAAPAGSRA